MSNGQCWSHSRTLFHGDTKTRATLVINTTGSRQFMDSKLDHTTLFTAAGNMLIRVSIRTGGEVSEQALADLFKYCK